MRAWRPHLSCSACRWSGSCLRNMLTEPPAAPSRQDIAWKRKSEEMRLLPACLPPLAAGARLLPAGMLAAVPAPLSVGGHASWAALSELAARRHRACSCADASPASIWLLPPSAATCFPARAATRLAAGATLPCQEVGGVGPAACASAGPPWPATSCRSRVAAAMRRSASAAAQSARQWRLPSRAASCTSCTAACQQLSSTKCRV